MPVGTNETYLAPEYVLWNDAMRGHNGEKHSVNNPNEYSDLWSCGVACLLMQKCEATPRNFARASMKEQQWLRFLKEGDNPVKQNEIDYMSSFYSQVFCLDYRSRRNNVGQDDKMNLNKQYRPSAEELLSDSRIFNDIEADDTEFAIWIVKRNRNAVKQCFQSCPNDARLLSNQTLNGGINIFFAVLVGEYYRTEKSKDMNTLEKTHNVLKQLGFIAPMEDWKVMEKDLKQWVYALPLHDQKIYLAIAFKHCELKFEWVDDILALSPCKPIGETKKELNL